MEDAGSSMAKDLTFWCNLIEGFYQIFFCLNTLKFKAEIHNVTEIFPIFWNSPIRKHFFQKNQLQVESNAQRKDFKNENEDFYELLMQYENFLAISSLSVKAKNFYYLFANYFLEMCYLWFSMILWDGWVRMDCKCGMK